VRRAGRIAGCSLPSGEMRYALALLLATVTAGCGGSAASPPDEQAVAQTDDPGLVHVHGLGTDPGDGTLYVATHTGLFRLAGGGSALERVGDVRYDLMGFTVVGPGHLLASGHPDPQSMVERQLPPHLGLIESRDAGATWRTISLPGEADFHALAASGEHVYGFDASNGRLLASADGGETWEERAAPGAVLDLAVDPDDPERLLAAWELGLSESRDGGRSWRALVQAVGLLAWPEPGRLYLVDGGGRVFASTDARAWQAVGNAGGPPAALHADGADGVHVAFHDGTIRASSDGGASWRTLAAPRP
jgi:hypothetical protein